jgi:hypothetical protein
MKKIFKISKSYFLQTLLLTVAIISYLNADEIGRNEYSQSGTYLEDRNNRNSIKATSISVSTGYTGGAISMGLICSASIVMIVWIEMNKQRKED